MEILLVDDHHEMRQALAELLEMGGHRVTAVETASEALARLEEQTFDRLVTDLEMPEIDGVALIAAARLEYPELPAILVSSSPEAPSRAQRLGVPVLPKPVDAEQLLSTVRRATPPTSSFPAAPPAPLRATGRPAVATREQAVTQRAKGARAEGTTRETGPAAGMGLGPGTGKILVHSIAARDLPPSSIRTSRHRHRGPLGITTAALLVVLGALTLASTDRAPELPSPPTSGVVRGSTLELLEPVGPLAEAPSQLRWRPSAGASRYRLVFERVDGRVFFQRDFEPRAGEGEALTFDLPTDFTASLRPMVVYYWWIEALDTAGLPIARSPRERIRILTEPAQPPIGGPE